MKFKGAYNSKAIYTPSMVRRILEAARLRGIRILLEFDTPGNFLTLIIYMKSGD